MSERQILLKAHHVTASGLIVQTGCRDFLYCRISNGKFLHALPENAPVILSGAYRW